MSYIRQTFKDFDENNPLSAAHMKHIEDGIVAAHEGFNSKVPLPATATIGTYLKVAEVDDQGRITKVETVALSGDGAELPTNVVTCDLEGATEDESAVPVNADTLGGELPEYYAKASGFTPVNFTSLVDFVSTETPFRTTFFLKVGNMVHIHYVGASKTHSPAMSLTDDYLLFTIPEGYRPYHSEINAVCIKYADTYGEVILKNTGKCYIYDINSTSVGGRLHFSMTYLCEGAEVTEVTT